MRPLTTSLTDPPLPPPDQRLGGVRAPGDRKAERKNARAPAPSGTLGRPGLCRIPAGLLPGRGTPPRFRLDEPQSLSPGTSNRMQIDSQQSAGSCPGPPASRGGGAGGRLRATRQSPRLSVGWHFSLLRAVRGVVGVGPGRGGRRRGSGQRAVSTWRTRQPPSVTGESQPRAGESKGCF